MIELIANKIDKKSYLLKNSAFNLKNVNYNANRMQHFRM